MEQRIRDALVKNRRLIMAVVVLLAFSLWAASVQAAVYRRGSTGEPVKQIQQKLKTWGFYTGNVDGIYGPMTESAVRKFQTHNGLKVDGIAGPQTLGAMGIGGGSQSGQSPGGGGSSGGNPQEADIYLVAKAVHGEARGEPYEGKVAVAAVIFNRVRHPSFPNTISGVVYQPGAFTAVADGQINLAPDAESLRAARDALNGWDPSSGAIYYYNPAKATNKWIFSRPILVVIGKHRFCS